MTTKNQTKIIWSVESHGLQDTIQLSKAHQIDALRVIYDPDTVDATLSFLQSRTTSQDSELAQTPVMIDVGSKPRAVCCAIEEPQTLCYGDTIYLVKEGQQHKQSIQVKTQNWESLFEADASVFLGYGEVVLKVVESSEAVTKTVVAQGGVIKNGVPVHVPATRKAPSIFDLDYIDIKPFQNNGIDYVVLPGVTTGREVAIARKKLKATGDSCPWLIVKIDGKIVYENMRDLLTEADGFLISRRELALTMEPAIIPMVCKEVIKDCNERAKLVFVESEMLASMRSQPTPTRAEVSDVANAIIDGTDAIVLSEEISSGPYKERALALSSSIIEDVEDQSHVELNWQRDEVKIQNEFDAVAFNAFQTAERLKAKAIVCLTKGGNTALRLASFKVTMPIIAVTFSDEVKRKLSLVRGVSTVVLDVAPKIDEVLPVVMDRLKSQSDLNQGDCIVFVTVSLSSIGNEASNLFTVQYLD